MIQPPSFLDNAFECKILWLCGGCGLGGSQEDVLLFSNINLNGQVDCKFLMVSAYMMLNYHISNSKTIYVSNSTEGNMLCSWSGFLAFCLWNFQEYWCKRLHPKNVCEKVYRQPPLRDSLKKGKLRRQDFSVTKQKTALLLAADSIGKKIQYDCPGFLSNRRQVIYLEYCSRMKIF